MKNLVTETEFTVSSADADMYGRVRPGALSNFFIQAAVASADHLGFGFENLQEHKLFWVLCRLTVEITRPLQWREAVRIETWPKTIDKLLYIRDFTAHAGGGICARATSGWLAVDIEKKRPKQVKGIEARLFDHLKDRHALSYPPQRIGAVINGTAGREIAVTYYDIDLNKHVTSTRYIDWMLDAFPAEYHAAHYPEKLSINYAKEILPEKNIRLMQKQAGPEEYEFEGKDVEGGANHFKGRIRFALQNEM